MAAALALALAVGGVPVFADLPECTGEVPPPCTILPSATDGNAGWGDCPDEGVAPGIGCENRWDELAPNNDHYLYLPTSTGQAGKLLLFLCGGKGPAAVCRNVYPVAAQQGYHVIGLTYPTGFDLCDDAPSCFGNLMWENVTGEDSSEASRISEHPQDSIVERLVAVLKWAAANNPSGGWGAYLTTTPHGMDAVDWSQVHIAGHSNGSSHASFMGTMSELGSVGRVALFAGPNDGYRDSDGEWIPMPYIQRLAGITDTRYYGLVHFLNKAESREPEDNVLFKVTRAWRAFGMGEPFNPDRREFHPDPDASTADFGGSHMLISMDEATTPLEAHNSVVNDTYCLEHDPPGDSHCGTFGDPIGYEAAWRCILGTGNAGVSSDPVADAGADQTLECQGGGGASAQLDGSGTRDADCDVLTYAWTGPFGQEGGWKPRVFVPLGTSLVTLVASDAWAESSSDTTEITVRDTRAPSLQVTLTSPPLWPPDHRLVRVEATVSVADTCGDAPPQVVLTSVTSDQPDNGVADGDTDNDVQDDAVGTFDRSFLVRAERAANDPRGRTYTVTYTARDASGNQAQASATVHVPFSE